MSTKQFIIIEASIIVIWFLISSFLLCLFGMAGTLDWEHQYFIIFWAIIITGVCLWPFLATLYEYSMNKKKTKPSLSQKQECYVCTFNGLNSFVFHSKEECIKLYEKHKEILRLAIEQSDYKECPHSRECDSFGIFEVKKGTSLLSVVWIKTTIE